MPKKPDAWTRFVSLFVRSDLEKQEAHTDEVIKRAETVRAEADRLLKLEYAHADKKYRGR